MTSAPEANIVLAVAGKFHSFPLAVEFSARKKLGGLYCIDKWPLPPPGVPWSKFHNRIDLALNSVIGRYVGAATSQEARAAIFEQWLVQLLANGGEGILHAWNGNCHRLFRSLSGSNWRLCVERSCPYNLFQYNLLREEAELLGVPHRQDMLALSRDIEELHLADVIIVPSKYSARSYTDPELQRKIRLNPLGCSVAWRERQKRNSGLNVLVVGNNFLRKGIHYIIEAFKLIDDPKARLWIRGDVPLSYRNRILDPRVTIIGPVLAGRLEKLYQDADIFVQASIDEGFGLTVLEALGHGLPLVITENVGAADILNSDVAVTVPIRDPEALATAILKARELVGAKFDAARMSIIQTNSWSACAERMMRDVYSA